MKKVSKRPDQSGTVAKASRLEQIFDEHLPQRTVHQVIRDPKASP